jgi:hypothetical protein
VVVHRGTRGQSFVYELVYDGQGRDGQPFLMGLIDPDALPERCGYDGKFAASGPEFAAQNGQFAGGSPPHRPPFAAGSPGGGNGRVAAPDADVGCEPPKNAENTVPDAGSPVVSYRQPAVVPVPRKASRGSE